MTERSSRLSYQPALDGLRAIAVLMVLFHHDNIGNRAGRVFTGGFLGVDVFFVLSGFLITGILLTAHERSGSTISLDFWYRRARRLLPAVAVLMVLASIYAVVWAPELDRIGIRGQGLATLFYVENWWVIAGNARRFTPFSQTWSLSIEEQWYLIWPFLLAALLWIARGSRRVLLGGVLVLAAASFLVMNLLYDEGRSGRAYVGTDARAWELLAGAALAVILLRGFQVRGTAARHAVEVGGIAGLATIVVSAFVMESQEPWVYRVGFLIVVVASALVILAAIQDHSPIVRWLLACRVLVWIGLISYGVYLYHLVTFMVIDQRRTGLSGAPLTAVRFAVVFGLAALSYLCIERPIRQGIKWTPMSTSIAGAALAAVVAVFVVATVPVPQDRIADQTGAMRALARTTPPGTTRALLAGDGLAFTIGFPLGSPIESPGIRATTATMLECGIVGGNPLIGNSISRRSRCPYQWWDLYREAVEEYDPEVVVLVLGRGEVFDRWIAGRGWRIGTESMEALLRKRLDRARRILTARGAKLLLTTVPCNDPSPESPPQLAVVEGDHTRAEWVNRVWRRFAAEHPESVQIVDLGEMLCPGGDDPHAVVDGVELRPDGSTPSPAGARVIWDRLLAPAIRAAPPEGGTARAPEAEGVPSLGG